MAKAGRALFEGWKGILGRVEGLDVKEGTRGRPGRRDVLDSRNVRERP